MHTLYNYNIIYLYTYHKVHLIEHILFIISSFSVPQVLQRPGSIDQGCQVISGFGRRLELTDSHLVLISCWYQVDVRQDEYNLKLFYCECQKFGA